MNSVDMEDVHDEENLWKFVDNVGYMVLGSFPSLNDGPLMDISVKTNEQRIALATLLRNRPWMWDK